MQNTTTTARAKAEKVLASLTEMYSEEITGGLFPAPTLMDDAYGSEFAIAWEEGPYEWALRLDGQPDRELLLLATDAGIDSDDATKLATTKSLVVPDGVEVEPFYSFVLCIDICNNADRSDEIT